jgi:hypothetical protein
VTGFAPTVTTKFYDGYCIPAYTFDKTNCGLIDAHQFTGDSTALAVLNKATDAVLPWLPEKALNREEMMARPHKNIAYTWDETYTLPENFYLGYQRGAGARYRQLAQRFLQDDTYFGPLSENRNVLPGQHAYSHVNALCSAMQSYLTDNSIKHLDAARNGFRFVLEQSFATGGWGPDEAFRKPGTDELAKTLHSSHSGFETPCGAYGHFKVARYLMRVTGDSTYGDSMEAVLYNTILGARPIRSDCVSFYYADYNTDAPQVRLRSEVAMLFRDLSTIDGGLQHQLLLSRSEGHLCQSIRTIASNLAARQRARHTHAADKLFEDGRDVVLAEDGPCGAICSRLTRACVGGKTNLGPHERKSRRNGPPTWNLDRAGPRMEGWRPRGVLDRYALAAASSRCAAQQSGPRWSPQKRPYVVTSKPAIAIGRRRDCFTLSRCIWASRDCCGLSRHLCSEVGGSEEWGHFGRIVAVLPLVACNHFRHFPA